MTFKISKNKQVITISTPAPKTGSKKKGKTMIEKYEAYIDNII